MTALAIDEIFFKATPVLMGVCPHSLTWVMAQKGPDRSGASWSAALTGWESVQRVLADGGLGLARGVAALQQRQKAAGQPAASMGLDLFHLKRDANRVVRQLWRRAEATWDEEVAADRRQPIHAGVRRSSLPVRPVRAKAAAAYGKAERQEQAWTRIAAALAVFRPDGRLNDRAWAEGEIAAARDALVHPAWKKVKAALDDPRTLSWLDDLLPRLAAAVPDEGLRAAVVERWRLRHGRGERTGLGLAEEAVQTVVCAKMSVEWPSAYAAVGVVLRGVVRASSAVECVNSVLRMQQARQRNVSPGMLDLKRLWWNTRRFGAGKRKGASPYERLGLGDLGGFWALLRADPEDLAARLEVPIQPKNLSSP